MVLELISIYYTAKKIIIIKYCSFEEIISMIYTVL